MKLPVNNKVTTRNEPIMDEEDAWRMKEIQKETRKEADTGPFAIDRGDGANLNEDQGLVYHKTQEVTIEMAKEDC